MPDYRRNYVPGGTYFFTCVTHLRAQILTTDLGRQCLREAIEKVRHDHPFEIVAIVLLPDHWHTVWILPHGDARYPMRWMRIKEEFTERWLDRGGAELPQSASRARHRQRGVWHKRYWEHTVRDEDDLKRCVDYVHWNPRKHKLVAQVRGIGHQIITPCGGQSPPDATGWSRMPGQSGTENTGDEDGEAVAD